MKLYVCWGTFHVPVRSHPCREAYEALKAAGHEPTVIKTYGFGALPAALNATTGRREVRELTGQEWVPVLVTDDAQAIRDSKQIIAWAAAHPAASSGRVGAADSPVAG
ncbi:MAG TPA: glutathione S-transferase N-terminal domain-containing protein [Conexibacter sp.]